MMPTVAERLETASRHLSQNRPDAAEAIYRDILQAEPRDAEATAGLGGVLLRRGLVEEAYEVLGRATSLDPKNAEAYRNLAIVYRARNELDHARTCLEAALALVPERVDILLSLGEVLLGLGAPDESRKLIEKAHGLDPDSVPVLIALGGLHTVRGDYPKAISCYGRAVSLAPDGPEGHANLAMLYGMTGRPKEALEHAERAVLNEPLNPTYVAVLAGALEGTGDIERGLALVNRALVMHPQAVALRCRLATLELAAGRPDQALSGIARTLKERRQDSTVLETMTQILHRAGRPEQALSAARELARHVPDSSQAARIERNALLMLGRYDEVWPTRAPAPCEGARILVRLDDALPVLETVALLRAVALGRSKGAEIRVLAPSFLGSLAASVVSPSQKTGDPEDGKAWLDTADTVPLVQLPSRLGLTEADLLGADRYLAPSAAKAARWRQALEGMPRPWIGFTWAPHRPGPRVEEVRDLLAGTGGTAVSLVWDQNRAQLSFFPAAIDGGVHIRALDDLVAVVSVLDAVIGVDGLPLHVAGAMGIPGLAVVAERQDWYWRSDEQGRALWYPSVVTVGRAPGEGWEVCSAAAGAALAHMMAGAVAAAGE
ncbi:tetratricopeptide repeat protein [Amorphus orientalis]|uniref:Tetratricopeptide (TPR) repeat protein n=1 Tax=Amorphus orientalis TaxID=649198 RepID=A0AAE3VTP2_9HYPH|nr:tetratricopeptide repeat protein [Amorphus orientalis]MDQ0317421.1 tetratricopeptide (TPR) repeat protein [Amorphus orientalis]